MTRTRPSRGSATEPIAIACAADNNFAMPLAVTVRSAIDHLQPHQPLHVYVLDGGITPQAEARVRRSWQDPRVKINWLRPDCHRIAGLKTEHHLNFTTYLRLFMPDLLPAAQKRVIFLDADLLIQKDLRALWDIDLADAPLAAVQDSYSPFIDTRETIGRPTCCDTDGQPWPIRNYREFGLDGSAPYFNAGVMLVNLELWRRIGLFHRATEMLAKYREHVHLCDQYALNVLFSKQWKQLDPRWNRLHIVWSWNKPADCPFSSDVFANVRNDPWIVHFSWIPKPWQPGCEHPWTDRYLTYLDRTDWKGWRPSAVPQPAGNWYQRYRRWYRHVVNPIVGPIKDRIRGKRRKAA